MGSIQVSRQCLPGRDSTKNSVECWQTPAGPTQRDDKPLKTRDGLLHHLAASRCAE
jgi:hypothetical protein